MSRIEVSPERAKEIEREKAKLRRELEDINPTDVIAQTETGERAFARKFKKLYAIRKALRIIEKKRTLKMYGEANNETAFNEAYNLVVSIVNSFGE